MRQASNEYLEHTVVNTIILPLAGRQSISDTLCESERLSNTCEQHVNRSFQYDTGGCDLHKAIGSKNAFNNSKKVLN